MKLLIALILVASATVASADTKLTWYGHAAFKIETPAGHVVLIDPWIQNPANAAGKDDLAKITKADLILVSHGHFDHVGDAADISKRTHAKLVATFDLGNALVGAGFPKENFGFDTGGNFGGTLTLLDGDVTITFVPAVHSSAVVANGDQTHPQEGGEPGGFVIAVKNGPTFYHTGDTDLFGDMALIGSHFKIDYMLGCIGDHFTMGPDRAAEATKLVKAKNIIPMHFGTFPVLTGTPAQLDAALKKQNSSTKMVQMKVDETKTL